MKKANVVIVGAIALALAGCSDPGPTLVDAEYQERCEEQGGEFNRGMNFFGGLYRDCDLSKGVGF